MYLPVEREVVYSSLFQNRITQEPQSKRSTSWTIHTTAPHTVDERNLPVSVHVYFLHVYRTISEEFSVRHLMVAIFTGKKHAENPIRNHPRNVMKGSKGLELRKYFKVWPWSVEGRAKVVKGNRPVSWFTLVFQIPPEKVF